MLHLIAVLAALYDDELKAVLLDEPDISLHPQLQAFVLREIQRVAGNPACGSKLIVLATHSAAMVRLRTLSDLPNLVFFNDIDTAPIQVNADNEILQNRRLAAFVRSLGAGHREVLFASRPLLVEGPSDEVVIDALDAAVGTNIHAAGSHILPLTGVNNLAPAVKLLRLIGKEPIVLADLDAFTDDLDLVNTFNDIDAGREAALEAGHGSLYEAVKGARNEFIQIVSQYWETISAYAQHHPYWTDCNSDADENARRRRAAAAILFQAKDEEVVSWSEGTKWKTVKIRMSAALTMLEAAGCFVLRNGTIEDSYATDSGRADKISAAYVEADDIIANPNLAAVRHEVAVRALQQVSQIPVIDESAAVAKAFVAVVAPALDELARNPKATTADLLAVTAQHTRESAALFNIERVVQEGKPSVCIELNAQVLDVEGFPIVLRSTDNINEVARHHIRPSGKSQSASNEP